MTRRKPPETSGKKWAWLAVVLAAGSVSACNGGSKASETAANPASTGGGDRVVARTGDPAATNGSLRGIVTSRKACDLLTRADAEAAGGEPLPQNTVNITLGMCDYNAADFSAGASVTVGSWESIKNAAKGGAHQPEVASGVGDEALNLGGNLYVRKGNEGFLLTLHGPKVDPLPDHGLAAGKDLAKKILARF